MHRSKSLEPWQVAELERLAAMPETEIDTSDAAEVTAWSRAKRGMFADIGGEGCTVVSLDAQLVAWFNSQTGANETLEVRINRALREYVDAHKQKSG